MNKKFLQANGHLTKELHGAHRGGHPVIQKSLSSRLGTRAIPSAQPLLRQEHWSEGGKRGPASPWSSESTRNSLTGKSPRLESKRGSPKAITSTLAAGRVSHSCPHSNPHTGGLPQYSRNTESVRLKATEGTRQHRGTPEDPPRSSRPLETQSGDKGGNSRAVPS